MFTAQEGLSDPCLLVLGVHLPQCRHACADLNKFVLHNSCKMSCWSGNQCNQWVRECLLLTSSWLCAGVVVVLVLTSQRVGTVSRLSVGMKDWASAYSDSESAGEENREFVERSSMQDKS